MEFPVPRLRHELVLLFLADVVQKPQAPFAKLSAAPAKPPDLPCRL